jgi:hypothetical protein
MTDYFLEITLHVISHTDQKTTNITQTNSQNERWTSHVQICGDKHQKKDI